MSKERKKFDISSLVDKYKSNEEVISHIEKSLNKINASNIDVSSLTLDPLFDLSLVKETKIKSNLVKIFPYIIYSKDDKNYLINNIYDFISCKKDEKISVYKVDLKEEEVIQFVYYYLFSNSFNILFLTHFFTLLNDRGYKDDDLSLLLSISISQIRNIKRLSSLPKEAITALKEEKISYTLARNLLNLPTYYQKELLKNILDNNLSNREVESLKRKLTGNYKKTKIKIKDNKVTITFDNEEEANSFYMKLMKEYK